MRSTWATLQNRAKQQYSSIYRGIQGIEALIRQQLSLELLQQIPLLLPAHPELERLNDEEEYEQEEQKEEAEGAAEDENAEDSEASKDDDQTWGVTFTSFFFWFYFHALGIMLNFKFKGWEVYKMYFLFALVLFYLVSSLGFKLLFLYEKKKTKKIFNFQSFSQCLLLIK